MLNSSAINFSKLNGLVPCVVQDARTHVVLMLGFMNEEAYKKTVADKKVTFYSRSKKRLWTKGESSGNYLTLVDVLLDCDQDTLLVKAIPAGPVCHTGAATCFGEDNATWNLETLEGIIQDRKGNPQKGSYTNTLLNAGINKVAQKVGEEAVELVIEAKDNNNDLFMGEAADLLYHYVVLLAAKNVKLKDVFGVLQKRHQKKS
ncbi:bifunctional phosphoribosyl-AMP cyclohydrolase/phosphoribosyl-ATP diphosphatase HisIE [Chryseolinea sp. T2]|uniref:bifunctional phosphoribosyl-AMP cyclohydrolase/phosphoribosyl-ATP diphosphatase HisIE n=1 Tax=Chryseolinea sp. T2 TaxID=3129255 RepID=UPI0030778749